MIDTPDTGMDDAFACSPEPDYQALQEFYFIKDDLHNEEYYEAIAENRKEVLKRVFKTINPIDAIHLQMKALDIIFHTSTLNGCSRNERAFFKDAFEAQKLYRESIKLLIKDDNK